MADSGSAIYSFKILISFNKAGRLPTAPFRAPITNIKNGAVMPTRVLKVAVLLAMSIPASTFAQEQPLVRLPAKITSPTLGYKNGIFGDTGRDTNVGGWLVLNGAIFLNSEYPDLAATLKEAYASTGYTPPDPDRTRLVNETHQTKSNGEIVRGMAICPSRTLCGDYVGTIQPFNLDDSL